MDVIRFSRSRIARIALHRLFKKRLDILSVDFASLICFVGSESRCCQVIIVNYLQKSIEEDIVSGIATVHLVSSNKNQSPKLTHFTSKCLFSPIDIPPAPAYMSTEYIYMRMKGKI